ncbi:MAG: UDP-N-acetylmuramate dehydrogenase [Firmicutes bacterium]|nr:UDP-N-acetylmuramate dehydrogenase [Bacillota bacterium]
MESSFEGIKEIYNGLIENDYDISSLMSWKIGGKVRCIVFPEEESQIINLINYINNNNIPYYIIGKGSNILFGNSYYNGLIIYLGKKFNSYKLQELPDGSLITCSSGISLAELGKIAKDNLLTGFEFLSFIPGSIGGAIITNAEAHKQSIGANIISVKVFENGIIKKYTNEMCEFNYRTSIFENIHNLVILSVELMLNKSSLKEITNKMQMAKEYRLNKQPKKPSAGSVFKNPNQTAAGKIIDDIGLKGLQKGDARISEIHGNFILNENKATSEDVIYLINTIRDRVKQIYDLDLKLEIKLFNL